LVVGYRRFGTAYRRRLFL